MALNFLEGFLPKDFGFDEQRFPKYRTHPVTEREVQLEVIEFAAYCQKRFAAASAPVGIGKMLIAVTLAKLTGLRCAVVVPLKGLEKQYLDEMSEHLVGVRGRGNYQCGDYAHLDCKGGVSMGCRYSNGHGCGYEVDVEVARQEDVVVTNYDYWLNKNAYGQGLTKKNRDAYGDVDSVSNPFGLLVLDEGDEAHQKVSEFLSCRVYENEIKRWVDPRDLGDSIETWKQFVRDHVEELTEDIVVLQKTLGQLGRKATKEQVAQLHAQERLFEKFERIASIQDDWVMEERIGTRWGRIWAFDVIAPGRYMEKYLYLGIPKVVFMAGTLTVKDLIWSGVPKGEYEYKQWDSIFPENLQPTYLYTCKKKNSEGNRVSVRIDKRTTQEDLELEIEHMDKLIESRIDRKILIGTTSYDWQKKIMNLSRYSKYMIGNTDDDESESAQEVAERFFELDMSEPRILISPSFGRGWNFSYSRAELAILFKCPFVPMQGKVMQARLKKDALYGDLLCVKKIEQFNGRIKRAPDDRGETFLIDGHFEYFLFRDTTRAMAQSWFVRSVRRVDVLPKAPPKLLVDIAGVS